MTDMDFGMRPRPTGSITPFGCRGCGNVVSAKTAFFMDEIADRAYCLPCGERLRYHRKKWAERGEELPRTFEEIDARFEKLMRGSRGEHGEDNGSR